MSLIFYFLQAGELPKAAYRLADYGPLGIYALITTSGFVVALWVIHRNYKDQLVDKDKQIAKLDRQLEACRQEMKELRDVTFAKVLEEISHNSTVISENSRAHYEAAEVMNKASGILQNNNDKLIDLLAEFLNRDK